MTDIQKAIKFAKSEIKSLELAPKINGCEMTEWWKEQIKIWKTAISALEKQIPKKPTPHIVQPVEAPIQIGNGRWQKRTTVYKCPNCKEWVSKTYKHCPDCGQALDFNGNGSDTE